jgi:hypothetical protein
LFIDFHLAKGKQERKRKFLKNPVVSLGPARFYFFSLVGSELLVRRRCVSFFFFFFVVDIGRKHFSTATC